MSLTPGTRLGPYEVLGSLGAGGMGEVYRARDTKLGRDVALKILPDTFANDPERLARFEREAKTLASLNHPHIAQIYGFQQSGTASALVMELVEGEDLSQRLARGAIPLEEAVPIAKQIAEALEAAHEQGIIHRDLKPANIKLRADGTVKVLDFGLAKAIDPGPGTPGSVNLANSPTITSPAMTARGMILGTAAYMAPEQAKGKPLDKRADIWAFGVVLFEMLTGHRLFAGDDPTEVIAAVIRQDIEWRALPETTPPSLRRLLARCLERDPRRRLRDIGDAQPDLAEVFSPGAARSPGSAARERWLTIAAAVATLAAILLAVPAIRHVREGSRAPDPVTRFVIDGPPKATRVLGPEISPDGRTLVFAGYVEGSPAPALWLRPFGEVDRSGTVAGTLGEPDLYSGPRLSPDNRHVAVTRLDARTRNGDIYLFDLEDRQWSRLTFDPADDFFPIWSPDGRYIAYRSNRNGKIQLMRKLSNGAGQEEVLYESDNRRLFADDWTADGKALILSQIDLKTNSDLWILPLDGARTLAPLVQTPADDPRARLSPDGRLLGYISSQSGRMETYVQPFPSLDGKWQLSESGGNSPPEWRRDGKELYYSSSGSLWAAAVVSQDPFVLGPAQRLFTEPPTQRGSFPAASSDGKRFLYSLDLVQLAAPKFNVIVNWAGDARQP